MSEEIFRIDAVSRKLLFIKQNNTFIAYTDRIEVAEGDYRDIIYKSNIENIFVADSLIPNFKERTIIIDNYLDNGTEARLQIPDSYFHNRLAHRMEELIHNEWASIGKMKQMTPTRRWINTAAALFYYADARDITTFGGLMPSEENAKRQQQVLGRSWEVRDKAGTSAMLESLLDARGTRQFMKDPVPGELSEFIWNEYGPKGIKAWDFVRAIHLAASAYIARYLTIEEASEYGRRAGKNLQDTFSNWDEMYANYLTGLSYWSGQSIYDSNTEAYQRNRIHETLRKRKEAPYKQIDWNYPLIRDW